MAISIIGGVGGISVESDPLALKLTGGTLSGKLNCGVVSNVAGINIGIGGNDTASVTAGDMWIASGGNNLNYRDSTGAWRIINPNNVPNQIVCSAGTINPALRIEQRGTGHALLVEDSTTPDSTPFVVTANGQTVIGSLTPYSTANLTVAGGVSLESGSYFVRVDSQGPQLQGSLKLYNQSTQNNTGSQTSTDYPYELVVEINNTTCYIPYRY